MPLLGGAWQELQRMREGEGHQETDLAACAQIRSLHTHGLGVLSTPPRRGPPGKPHRVSAQLPLSVPPGNPVTTPSHLPQRINRSKTRSGSKHKRHSASRTLGNTSQTPVRPNPHSDVQRQGAGRPAATWGGMARWCGRHLLRSQTPGTEPQQLHSRA